MLSDSLKEVPSEWHIELYRGGVTGKFQSSKIILSSKFHGEKRMKEEPTDRRNLIHVSKNCNVRTLSGT